MISIKRKLTTFIIILLGLSVITPTLFADPAPTHRRRPAVRQEMRQKQHRGWNFPRFINRLARRIVRNRIRRQVRRNMRRNIRRNINRRNNQWHRQHNHNNNNRWGHNR